MEKKLPGVGLGVVGTPVTYMVEPTITARYNPAFERFLDPRSMDLGSFRFDAQGNVGEVWSGLLLGGLRGREAGIARPRIGAENEFLVAARILRQAFLLGRPSFGDEPFQWLGEPDQYSGSPNQYERVVYGAIADPGSTFAKTMYAASSFDDPVGLKVGLTPELPLQFTGFVRFPAAQRQDGTYYRFFTEDSVGGQGAGKAFRVYVQHPTPDGRATAECYGYSPTYTPQAFGPDPRPARIDPQPQPVGADELARLQSRLEAETQRAITAEVETKKAEGKLKKAKAVAKEAAEKVGHLTGGGLPLKTLRKLVADLEAL